MWRFLLLDAEKNVGEIGTVTVKGGKKLPVGDCSKILKIRSPSPVAKLRRFWNGSPPGLPFPLCRFWYSGRRGACFWGFAGAFCFMREG